MKAIDFRNTNFWHLRGTLEVMRKQVYDAWCQHGPGTTREIAQRSGIDLLSLRPRSTELLELGLLEIVCDMDGTPERSSPGRGNKREGVYNVTPVDRWNQWRSKQVNGQLQLI